MTCIAGVEQGGKVFIGGDSAGVGGYSLTVRADEKVWTTRPARAQTPHSFVFGFTSSFRMGQLLRYNLSLPLQRYEVGEGEAEEIKFMTTHFVDAVRAVLKTGGYVKNDGGREEGGTFLVGWRGRLYYVGGDFQVGRALHGINAVGCGGELALGALYATRGQADAKKRVLTALAAAESYSAGVRGPFKVVHG